MKMLVYCIYFGFGWDTCCYMFNTSKATNDAGADRIAQQYEMTKIETTNECLKITDRLKEDHF